MTMRCSAAPARVRVVEAGSGPRRPSAQCSLGDWLRLRAGNLVRRRARTKAQRLHPASQFALGSLVSGRTRNVVSTIDAAQL